MINRRNRVLHYTLRQLEVFQKNLAQAVQDADIDAVHDMRVAVKKLRAAGLLSIQLDKSKTLFRELEQIRPLYKVSGRLRDLQLKQELMHRNFKSIIHQPIHDFIERQTLHHKQQFLELSSRTQQTYFSRFAAVSDTLLHSVSESEFNHIIQTRISSHVHTARLYVANASTIRDYHLARRYIKQVFHIMLMSGIVSWSDLQARFTRRNLKILEESIGKWHDHVQMKLWFESLHNGISFPSYNAVHNHFHIKSERMIGRAMEKFHQIAGSYD